MNRLNRRLMMNAATEDEIRRPSSLHVSPKNQQQMVHCVNPQNMEIDALKCNLSKCLVLSTMMFRNDLLNDQEIDLVKRYLMDVQDTAKLNYLVRSYERTRCLITFRRSLAGFMGAP